MRSHGAVGTQGRGGNREAPRHIYTEKKNEHEVCREAEKCEIPIGSLDGEALEILPSTPLIHKSALYSFVSTHITTSNMF